MDTHTLGNKHTHTRGSKDAMHETHTHTLGDRHKDFFRPAYSYIDTHIPTHKLFIHIWNLT